MDQNRFPSFFLFYETLAVLGVAYDHFSSFSVVESFFFLLGIIARAVSICVYLPGTDDAVDEFAVCRSAVRWSLKTVVPFRDNT